MQIEDATKQDVPQIAATYNEVIATSSAVFSDLPVSVEDRLEWLRSRRSRSQLVLVAREDREVLGFATYGDFRSWAGHRSTVEHSVRVAARRRRQGVRRRLVEDAVERARRAGNAHRRTLLPAEPSCSHACATRAAMAASTSRPPGVSS